MVSVSDFVRFFGCRWSCRGHFFTSEWAGVSYLEGAAGESDSMVMVHLLF